MTSNQLDSLHNKVFFVDPGFKPRPYQVPVFKAFAKDNKKRVILVWHRRAGKDKTCHEILFSEAVRRPGNYWYMFPEKAQGREAFWNSIDGEGVRIIDRIPEHYHYRKPSDMEMTLYIKTLDNLTGKNPKSHSTIKVVGARKNDNTRGSNPVGVVCSEYSLPEWQNVYEEVIEPILVENKGWCLFNFTPKGKNHSYRLLQAAKNDPEYWYTSVLTVDQTTKRDKETNTLIPVMPPDEINRIKNRTPDQSAFQREYFCSFDAPPSGAYLSEELIFMQERQQITPLTFDPNLPVYTGWDLGVGESLAVWFFQYDPYKDQLFAIDYMSFKDGSISSIAPRILNKPYNYRAHIAPHDVVARDTGSGLTRVQTAQKHGINFYDATNTLTVAQKLPVNDSIDLMRQWLPKIIICQVNCKDGLECLENYSRKYHKASDTYLDKPCDGVGKKYSHGADAFRTFTAWWQNNHKHEKIRLLQRDKRSYTPTVNLGD